MSIIAIANQKGGVGKTTTASALIAGMSKQGKKVLGVDMDPQGNLSYSLGAECYQLPTTYELLRRETPAEKTIQQLGEFDAIPANIMLAGIEQELSQIGKEHRLEETLHMVVDNYDYIIVDTPPSLGILTVNALTFADSVIIPATADVYASNGIRQLSNTIESIKMYCNPNLQIDGILVTRFNPRTKVGKQNYNEILKIGEELKVKVYKTFIKNSVAVEEAQTKQQSVIDYSRYSTVSMNYQSFIDEFQLQEETQNV